jgi:subtilisin family serine protease
MVARRVRVLLVGLLLGVAGVVGPVVRAAAQAEDPPARYIVRLADPPLASYRGGIADLLPTNPRVLGQVKLDVASPASLAYLDYLTRGHRAATAAMAEALGHPVKVIFDYRHAFNGLAVELTPAQADVVRGLPDVADVQPDFERHTLGQGGNPDENDTGSTEETGAGAQWIGAPAIWDGTATGKPGTRGEGVVIGVIDTGINVNHPSFTAKGDDGYQHHNPRGRFYGLCAPLDGAPFCNDKLIGVHDFTATSPLDDNGHGSHTASTAAGNMVSARVSAPTTSFTQEISGVAPHANLISYKACLVIGSCTGVSLVAAVDQAIPDGVDVLNFSIGGGPSDPWRDADAQAFLGARDAGVLAVVAAGNSGPEAGTVGSPAGAPWVLSVGASTHDRLLLSSVAGLAGGATRPPDDIVGTSLTAGYGPALVVYAGDFGDPLCSGAFLPGTFHGEIVICDRGGNARLEKGRNVRLGGAGGMILGNSAADGEATVADAQELPTVAIGFTAGRALKEWVSTGTGHRGTITPTAVGRDPTRADVLAGFSSRGPNSEAPDVLKPDVTAPGVDVLAAVNSANPLAPAQFGVLSGTSMASPHTAGAAALIRALHPDWTPAQVVSVLTSTGHLPGLREDDGVTPADPFDRGSGRIDLVQAARAGLVLGETGGKFRAANPATGGDPATLNLATLSHQSCPGRCAWQREVTNTLPTATTWRISTVAADGLTLTVTPRALRLAPGETAVLTLAADATALPRGQWAFGSVTLTPDTAAPAGTARPGTPAVQHLTVAVLPGGPRAEPTRWPG